MHLEYAFKLLHKDIYIFLNANPNGNIMDSSQVAHTLIIYNRIRTLNRLASISIEELHCENLAIYLKFKYKIK